jgi:hypothetical protein
MGHGAVQFTELRFPAVIDQPLGGSQPFALCAQATVLRHFRELLRQREHVMLNDDVEAVHEIRVAARRTRTALQTFGTLWPDSQIKRHLSYLAKLADAFGVARDTDVMVIYIEKQLKTASEPRTEALQFLLRRAKSRRKAEQPELERLLMKTEKGPEGQAFIDYFAGRPLDLWQLSDDSAADAAAASVELDAAGPGLLHG